MPPSAATATAAQAAALALALGARGGAAWRAEGTLPAGDSFVFYAGKFCFDYVPHEDGPPQREGQGEGTSQKIPAAGMLEVQVKGQVEEVTAPANDMVSGSMYLMIFDDEDQHWQEAYARWNELSCVERMDYASNTFRLSDDLSVSPHRSQLKTEVHQAIRPRWWYFAFVNCGARLLEPIHFEVHATNPTHGWQSEFSMDADGSLGLQTLFCCLFALSTAYACRLTGPPWGHSARSEASRPRPWLRLLQASSCLSAAGCSLSALHHSVYAINGWGLVTAEMIAAVCACSAKLALSMLQLLIAGGWALQISGEQAATLRGAVGAAVLGIFLVSVLCEFHQEYGRDTSSAIYLYESWPGTVILLMNITLLVISCKLMRETYQRENAAEAKTFYLLVSAAMALYYVSLPVICVLSTLLSPWVRLKYVQRVELCIRLGVTILLLRQLKPSHLDMLINRRIEAGLDNKLHDVSDSEPEASRENSESVRKEDVSQELE